MIQIIEKMKEKIYGMQKQIEKELEESIKEVKHKRSSNKEEINIFINDRFKEIK